MSFKLNIISLKGKIFSGEVDRLTVPAESGAMTVLQNHMPMVAPLKTGKVIVRGEEELDMVIGKGVFTMSDNKADLLVEDVSSSEEISEKDALAAMKRAKEIIEKAEKEQDIVRAKYDLKRSKEELRIARDNGNK